MFKAIRSSSLNSERYFTVSVGQGSRPTTASWSLPDPADVMDLLGKLAGAPTKDHSEL